MTPPPAAMRTESTPRRTARREPQMTRLKTSRPRSSVPKRCADDGPCSMSRGTSAIGSWVAMSGAKSAVSSSAPKSASPEAPNGDRMSRRSTSRIADPRIEPGIQQIDDEIRDEGRDGDQQHGPLDHREVTIEDGLYRKEADAGPAED